MTEQQSFYEKKLEYEIDAWDLSESLKHGESIKIIDARSEEAYANEHIPGSINVPHRIMNSETTSHLNKNLLYVCYCDGIGCNASTKAALNLLKLGFKVKELIGGIDWWKRDGYETSGKLASAGKKIVCGC